MKITGTFLALLVLALSTHSMLVCVKQDAQPARKERCSSVCSKKDEQRKSDDQGCTDYCNPFMSCSGCLYTMTGVLEFSLAAINEVPVKAGKAEKKDLLQYSADCWHPPRNYRDAEFTITNI